MQYTIEGTPLPVVICTLENGEVMITERGSMSWMSSNMKMETTSNGGVGKAFGRMFSGEALFQNRYSPKGGSGLIAFASSFPGSILPFNITPDNGIVVQKGGFLAGEAGVNMSIFFQKKVSSAMFGGEGFVMQKLSGNGVAFVEIDGYAVEYTLAQGESMIVDTGYLAAMSDTCTVEIVTVQGVKNMIFGGEGVFNTLVKGPGKLYLQTLPINSVASSLLPYFPVSK
ncbi:MAG: TIGR00266 family protein [Oscillospiraceae bacterium]